MVDSRGLLDRTGPESYLVGTFGTGEVDLRCINTESRSCYYTKNVCRTNLAEIRRDAVGSSTSSEQDYVRLQTFTISKLLC
jgi:hypothetical protein